MAEIHELRSRFAAALSRMYGREVGVHDARGRHRNRSMRTIWPAPGHRGTPRQHRTGDRGTAWRNSGRDAAEMHDVAVLFAGFGMYPVGFYDLREATPPVPVV
ncbi:DUF1338 family protein, partial [Rhodococcus hoagii]|nr:DUF1338 family protein [Prescottella equi]